MKIKILSNFIDEYQYLTNLGIEIAKSKKIAITGLARNVANQLPYVLDILDTYSDYFHICKYFIYENDSTDDTIEILKKWSCQNNRYFLSESLNSTHPCGPESKSNLRTQALSSYRNKCKEYIANNFTDIDYVLVIDLDFEFYNFEGIFNSIGFMNKNSDINIMAGVSYLVQNNMLLNYDSWAYRHTWWEDLQENMHWFPMWFPFAGSLPFKVNSAFGGSVLYETKMFLSADYDGYDCEHVCFHKNILTKNPECKLFMNPSQLMVV